MASKKRRGAKAGTKGARLGARVGARVAPKASKIARRAAWKAAKGEARLVRRAASSREPRGLRFLKYGFFALVGLAVGTAIARSGRNGGTPSFSDTTGQRGETGGTATPTGTA